MYYSQALADRIKSLAKKKNIPYGKLLSDCGINTSSLNQMSDKKGLGSFSLAKIADQLDCSVDYLLCRTETVSLSQTAKSDLDFNKNNFEKDLINLYDFLQTAFTTEAEDICCALEFLLDSLRNANNSIGSKIRSISNDYDNVSLFSNYGKIAVGLINSLMDYLGQFNDSQSLIPEKDEDSGNEDDEKKIPNYTDYAVNSDIVHYLSESYTYKKICAFMLDGVRYNTKNWKTALIKLCELLVRKNAKLFNNVLSSDDFKGKKNIYFSTNSNGNEFYKPIEGTNIYVWTNLNANAICSIMRKLLHLYEIPLTQFYVFLRADYTPLHTQPCLESISEAAIGVDDNSKKIGEFVRLTMRKLSTDNYEFSDELLLKLTSGSETKKMFGIGIPFFKEVTPKIPISDQTKDIKGYNRYWKEVFEFNGHQYLVVSQWTKSNEERIKKWLDDLVDGKTI